MKEVGASTFRVSKGLELVLVNYMTEKKENSAAGIREELRDGESEGLMKTETHWGGGQMEKETVEQDQSER